MLTNDKSINAKKNRVTNDFIKDMPKAELHVHIEGTFEPKLMFKIAKRNNKKIKYSSVTQLKKAYNFHNLQDFLDIYYNGVDVLIKEQDFYDLTLAYLEKAHAQNVIHTEIFFDPQAHTRRGINFSIVIKGIHKALEDGKKKLGISSKLIMCFLRDLDEKSALQTLKEALKYKQWIIAVGLDSSEVGNPPLKFQRAFKIAKKQGYLTVGHAGEEGPAKYVWEALKVLKVSRVDHGNHSFDDPKLVNKLIKNQLPLTMCPLSNLKLKVIKDLKHHPLKNMLNKGLIVTINSDDPAYFGGYINENYLAIAKALRLSKMEIYQLAKNSIIASFLSQKEKQCMIQKIDNYLKDRKNEII